MKKISILAITVIAVLFTSCKKSPVIPLESTKELRVVLYDSSKYGGYVPCGTAGNVDANGFYFVFIAPSEKGAIKITEMKFKINVNDESKPFTMLSMWDNNPTQRDILVTGKEVTFFALNMVIPEGDNGRQSGVSFTYSGIGRNGVVSGKTVSSVTLVSVTYADQSGLKKTIYPNIKSPDRMSTYSLFRSYNYYYPYLQHGLAVGKNKNFSLSFNSIGGDHDLKEIPLKIKTVDCSIGNLPSITLKIKEEGISMPEIELIGKMSRIDDSTTLVKIPEGYKVKKDHSVTIDFYVDVLTVGSTSAASLKTSLGSLKYLKYVEVATGTNFSAQNENFMWTDGWWYPYYTPFEWEVIP